jgi:hypothetical protein
MNMLKTIVMYFTTAILVGFNCNAVTIHDKIVAYLHVSGHPSPRSVFSSRDVILIDKLDGNGITIHKWNVQGIEYPNSFLTDENTLNAMIDLENVEMMAKQNLKPVERKILENSFYSMCTNLLYLAGDGRFSQVPPVKLTTDEISDYIEAIMQIDSTVAIPLSLKFLALDSALKRYDTLWWDDAHWHEDVVNISSKKSLPQIKNLPK